MYLFFVSLITTQQCGCAGTVISARNVHVFSPLDMGRHQAIASAG